MRDWRDGGRVASEGSPGRGAAESLHPGTRPLVDGVAASICDVAEPHRGHSNMRSRRSAPIGAMLVVSSIPAPHRRHFGPAWLASSMPISSLLLLANAAHAGWFRRRAQSERPTAGLAAGVRSAGGQRLITLHKTRIPGTRRSFRHYQPDGGAGDTPPSLADQDPGTLRFRGLFRPNVGF